MRVTVTGANRGFAGGIARGVRAEGFQVGLPAQPEALEALTVSLPIPGDKFPTSRANSRPPSGHRVPGFRAAAGLPADPICYTPRMNPNEYWHEYVGDERPADFMRKIGCREPENALDTFMERHPRVFGIALRRTWSRTFQQMDQFNWRVVRGGLAAYLEETRASWEAEVADLPEKPKVAPPPVFVPVQIPFEGDSFQQEFAHELPPEPDFVGEYDDGGGI